MAFLELHGINKSFGANTVVRSLSLDVAKGEFVSLLGGSGCGKTTTLRMIAGFETPDEGRILMDGVDVSGLAPNRRKLGMVFQNYALFPNMNVRRNIAFGLRIAGVDKPKIEKRIDEMLELIHMEEFAQRFPHQLSGGQQQRVALARAVAVEPAALLLDEPLSALDAKIRLKLRDDIRSIQRALKITTIYVTHDQEEALSISDRVAVMLGGRIEQIGTPFEIYNRPATPYVASFIGTLNVLPVRVSDPAAGRVEVEGQSLRVADRLGEGSGAELSLRIRPEAMSISAAASGAHPLPEGFEQLRGRLENLKFLGSIVRQVVKVGSREVFADEFNDPSLVFPAIGDEVVLRFPREACSVTRPEAAPVVVDAED
jgi:putative spermidine/putrescine transport system ATP-binding protein